MSENPSDQLKIALWNSRGDDKLTTQIITELYPFHDIIIITETWLLSPKRLLSNWTQYHTYASKVPNSHHGQIGLTILINPNIEHTVTHLPTNSLYTNTIRINNTIIHGVYLPHPASPSNFSLSPTEVQALFDSLLITGPTITQTIICGDFNGRQKKYLGDTIINARGNLIMNWATTNGLSNYNSQLLYGQPTFHTYYDGIPKSSIVDLFFSTTPLPHPQLEIHPDPIGSDHFPLSLSLSMTPLISSKQTIHANYGTYKNYQDQSVHTEYTLKVI